VKKVKKNRFGGVVRSEVEGTRAMLDRYREEALMWVEGMVKERWREMGRGEDGEELGEGDGEDGDETEEEVEQDRR
jgi:histone deacetylase 6